MDNEMTHGFLCLTKAMPPHFWIYLSKIRLSNERITIVEPYFWQSSTTIATSTA